MNRDNKTFKQKDTTDVGSINQKKLTNSTAMKGRLNSTNVREDNHDHPPTEGTNIKEPTEGTSRQIMCKNSRPLDDTPMEDWSEELNQDEYEKFIHHDHLSDVDMDVDYNPMPLPGRSFQDGGYTRRIVTTFDEWERVISRFRQHRGWEEGEECNSSEEEYDSNHKECGPCRKEFGHIGPDKEDQTHEYHYRGEEVSVQRDDFRKYKRPPFFLPETTQKEFY